MVIVLTMRRVPQLEHSKRGTSALFLFLDGGGADSTASETWPSALALAVERRCGAMLCGCVVGERVFGSDVGAEDVVVDDEV